MAPFIDNDFDCLSSSDHQYDPKMYEPTPLHENAIPQTPATTVVPPKKTVSFNDKVWCFDVVNLDDYTDRERNDCWFGADAQAAMKQNARCEARLVDKGLLREDTLNYTTTVRGLEGKTRAGQQRRKEKRLEAYAAVFSEIEFQSEEQFRDDGLIADAYFVYSDACALEAATIAASDAIAATIIYKEDAAIARQQQRKRQLCKEQQHQKQQRTQKSSNPTKTRSSFFRFQQRPC